jgi:hypothetical protein
MARITVLRIRRATFFRPPSTAIAQGDATPYIPRPERRKGRRAVGVTGGESVSAIGVTRLLA